MKGEDKLLCADTKDDMLKLIAAVVLGKVSERRRDNVVRQDVLWCDVGWPGRMWLTSLFSSVQFPSRLETPCLPNVPDTSPVSENTSPLKCALNKIWPSTTSNLTILLPVSPVS